MALMTGPQKKRFISSSLTHLAFFSIFPLLIIYYNDYIYIIYTIHLKLGVGYAEREAEKRTHSTGHQISGKGVHRVTDPGWY